MAIKNLLESNTQVVELATSLLAELNDREGQYVWVKYETETLNEITVTNPSFKITVPANAPVGAVTMSYIKGFADNLDEIDLMFFDGFTGTSGSYKMFFDWDENWSTMFLINRYGSSTDNNGVLTMGYEDGVLSIKTKQTWGSAAMSAIMTYEGTKTIQLKRPKVVPTTRIGYVFSDDINAYPNGDVEDGYWYQLVPIGSDCVECGEITITSSVTSVTVGHSLGFPPSYVALVPKAAFSVQGTASIAHVILNEIYIYSKFFSGSGSYGLTTAEIEKSAICTDADITFTSSYTIRTGDYYWIALAKERGIRQ